MCAGWLRQPPKFVSNTVIVSLLPKGSKEEKVTLILALLGEILDSNI
jgi:hypothetical protein